MFNLIKLGLHFTHSAYGALDPMVLELIRTERLMRQTAEKKPEAPQDLSSKQDAIITPDQKAA